MEYYSAVKRNGLESVELRKVNLEPVIQSEVSQKEKNNKMGKTKNLFKKIRGTKGTFCTKMDTMKDRNGMDLTEAEDINKR